MQSAAAADPTSSSDGGGQSSGDDDDESSRESLAQQPLTGAAQDQESCSTSSSLRSPSPSDQPIVDESDPLPHDSPQLQQDKAAIYKHPLLPLVALLLEKCEFATATLRMQTDSAASSSSSSSSAGAGKSAAASLSGVPFDAFNAEVKSFVQMRQSEGKPLISEDPDLDNLMIKAIQVLRIHLLELEKVQDLCKDFCQRYITCLRTKMSSENLLRGASGIGAGGDGFDDSSRSSSPSSGENSPAPPFHRPTHPQSVYQMVQTNQELANQALRLHPGSSRDSSLPIVSQRLPVLDTNRDSGNEGDLSDDASNANGCSSGGSGSKKSSQKRGILPKQATSVMRSWLFQHIVHPYPTEDEKRAIATQTNLTLLQVNNWFINARRRILQPMLDSANSLNSNENNSNNNMSSQSRSSPSPSAKKLKGGGGGSGGGAGSSSNNKAASSMHRFWSDSVSSDVQGGVSARSSAD